MKLFHLTGCLVFACLGSTACGAATLQTKDFALQLDGNWRAFPVQASDHANAYVFAKAYGGGFVTVLVNSTWAGIKQDKTSLQSHIESLTRVCLESQLEGPLPKHATFDRCEVAGIPGKCAEFVHTPKVGKALKGICMGWATADDLIYTVSWTDVLPEAEDELPKMIRALKSIKLPQTHAPKN